MPSAPSAAAVGPRVGRREAAAGEVRDVADLGGVGHRDREPAAAEAEGEQLVELDARLDDLVASGDAELDRPVGRPARNVVGAREQELEVEVEAVHVQRAAVRREADAGVVQQLLRALGQAALRGQREAHEPRPLLLVSLSRRATGGGEAARPFSLMALSPRATDGVDARPVTRSPRARAARCGRARSGSRPRRGAATVRRA